MVERELKNILGKNIKFFRFRSQYSQSKLAEKANISITFLSNIERGNSFPYAATLCDLAQALSVQVHELFKSEKTPEVSPSIKGQIFEDIAKNVNQAIEKVREQYED